VKTCVVTEHEQCEVELPVEGTIVIKTGKVFSNCYISHFRLTIILGVILISSLMGGAQLLNISSLIFAQN